MPQVSAQEFERLRLRVHTFLAGASLHDAWTVDLPHWRKGLTLDQFLRTIEGIGGPTPSPPVRILFGIRSFGGRVFGWDREPPEPKRKSFAERLTGDDKSRSLVPSGTLHGSFRVVYRFENEMLLELINRTVHAAALSALVETENAYHFYFAVYVCNVSMFTPLYMALIDPFRKLIVYPSLLRGVRASWNQAFGTA